MEGAVRYRPWSTRRVFVEMPAERPLSVPTPRLQFSWVEVRMLTVDAHLRPELDWHLLYVVALSA